MAYFFLPIPTDLKSAEEAEENFPALEKFEWWEFLSLLVHSSQTLPQYHGERLGSHKHSSAEKEIQAPGQTSSGDFLLPK